MDKICKNGKTTKNSSKLSLYPLKFEEAVKDLLKVKPLTNGQLQEKKHE